MTPSDIERMAREAGFDRLTEWREGQPAPWVCTTKDLARFAALVRAQALEDAARVAEEISDKYQEAESWKWPELRSDAETGADRCAAAIRAIASDPAP